MKRCPDCDSYGDCVPNCPGARDATADDNAIVLSDNAKASLENQLVECFGGHNQAWGFEVEAIYSRGDDCYEVAYIYETPTPCKLRKGYITISMCIQENCIEDLCF